MVTHCSILAWRSPRTEEPGGLQSVHGVAESDKTKRLLLSHDFPGGSDGKESACNVGDLGSIPQLGRSPGGRHGNPLQYSCLENPMDRGAEQATASGVTKSQT